MILQKIILFLCACLAPLATCIAQDVPEGAHQVQHSRLVLHGNTPRLTKKALDQKDYALQKVYHYDTKGRLIHKKEQSVFGEGFDTNNYTYNQNGLLEEEERKINTQSGLVRKETEVLTYNDRGQQLTSFMDIDDVWRKTLYTYKEGQLYRAYTYGYAWFTQESTVSVYASGLQVERYETVGGVQSSRTVMVHDDEGHLLEGIEYNKDDQPYRRMSYTYDAHGNQVAMTVWEANIDQGALTVTKEMTERQAQITAMDLEKAAEVLEASYVGPKLDWKKTAWDMELQTATTYNKKNRLVATEVHHGLAKTLRESPASLMQRHQQDVRYEYEYIENDRGDWIYEIVKAKGQITAITQRSITYYN